MRIGISNRGEPSPFCVVGMRLMPWGQEYHGCRRRVTDSDGLWINGKVRLSRVVLGSYGADESRARIMIENRQQALLQQVSPL